MHLPGRRWHVSIARLCDDFIADTSNERMTLVRLRRRQQTASQSEKVRRGDAKCGSKGPPPEVEAGQASVPFITIFRNGPGVKDSLRRGRSETHLRERKIQGWSIPTLWQFSICDFLQIIVLLGQLRPAINSPAICRGGEGCIHTTLAGCSRTSRFHSEMVVKPNRKRILRRIGIPWCRRGGNTDCPTHRSTPGRDLVERDNHALVK